MKVTNNSSVQTVLPAAGHFLIGATKDSNGSHVSQDGFVGQMSYLNIWSAVLPMSSISAMSSGGVNVNGDLLAWRNVPKYIVGNLDIKNKTVVYFPG